MPFAALAASWGDGAQRGGGRARAPRLAAAAGAAAAPARIFLARRQGGQRARSESEHLLPRVVIPADAPRRFGSLPA